MKRRNVLFIPLTRDPLPFLAAIVGGRDCTTGTDDDPIFGVSEPDPEEGAQGHDVFVTTFGHQLVEQRFMLRVPGLPAVSSMADVAEFADHPAILLIDKLDTVVDDVRNS